VIAEQTTEEAQLAGVATRSSAARARAGGWVARRRIL